MFERNENRWWVDVSTLINSNDEKGVKKKGNVINYLCDVLRMENSLKGLLINCWYCIMIVLWIVQCYEIFRFLIILWTCHLHYSETWFWQVLYKLRKNKKLKRMYHFKGTHASWWILYFLGTYRAPRWLLLSKTVSHAIMDAWTDMPPMGQRLRNRGCITRSHMHHYTWNLILLH